MSLARLLPEGLLGGRSSSSNEPSNPNGQKPYNGIYVILYLALFVWSCNVLPNILNGNIFNPHALWFSLVGFVICILYISPLLRNKSKLTLVLHSGVVLLMLGVLMAFTK